MGSVASSGALVVSQAATALPMLLTRLPSIPDLILPSLPQRDVFSDLDRASPSSLLSPS